MISPKNKLLLKRWVAWRLRALVDLVEGRLHDWEVSLRTEPKSLPAVVRSAAKREPEDWVGIRNPARVTFTEWEARRSGIRPTPKRSRQHRGAADFDRELREHFSRVKA
jgi:hypothetical protein